MKKAFTLTELSIVVLIIGVLITGITQGSGNYFRTSVMAI
jgi:prepilin-type N-terminal cleavage/methylation domain-containing protein